MSLPHERLAIARPSNRVFARRAVPHHPLALLSLLAAFAAVGCDDDDATQTPEDRDPGLDEYVEGTEPVYGYFQNVASPELEGSFVTVTNDLDYDADAPALKPDKAREVAGEPIALSRQIVVNEEVEFTQYKVDDDLVWYRGDTLSFAKYPLGEDGANFFNQWIVDDSHVYLMFDKTSRIVWNPQTMRITDVMEDSKLEPEFEGLQLWPAGNRTAFVSGDQPTMMAYFYKDEDWWKFGSKSVIALYDRDTHEEQKLIDVPCPGLAVASRDEDGYTYFGTWDYKAIVHLYGMGPKPCIARITPDGELDEDFTTDLAEWTGGLYGKKFQYVRDGWAFMHVIDHTKLDFDWSAEQADPAAVDAWWADENARLWVIDLENKSAHPFEGFDEPISDVEVIRVDDRVFLSVTYDFFERQKLYELNEDNSVTPYNEYSDRGAVWRRIR